MKNFQSQLKSILKQFGLFSRKKLGVLTLGLIVLSVLILYFLSLKPAIEHKNLLYQNYLNQQSDLSQLSYQYQRAQKAQSHLKLIKHAQKINFISNFKPHQTINRAINKTVFKLAQRYQIKLQSYTPKTQKIQFILSGQPKYILNYLKALSEKLGAKLGELKYYLITASKKSEAQKLNFKLEFIKKIFQNKIKSNFNLAKIRIFLDGYQKNIQNLLNLFQKLNQNLKHFQYHNLFGELEKINNTQLNLTHTKIKNHIIQFYTLQPSQLKSILKTAVDQKILPRNINWMINPSNHQFIIHGSFLNYSLFKNFIDQIDQAPSQVEIAVKIVAIDSRGLKEMGVNWTAGNSSIQGGVQAGLGASMGQLGFLFDKLPLGFALNLQLQALESEGEGKVISSPTLTVFNQKTAQIEQGQDIPYSTAVVNNGSVVSQVQFKKVVLGLKVQPMIMPGDHIQLAIDLNNDTVSHHLGSAHKIPIIHTTALKTDVSVLNGQTLVLGGLKTTLNTQSVKQVPILGSLPLLGHLFSQHFYKNQQAKLLIFVTPHIVSARINKK